MSLKEDVALAFKLCNEGDRRIKELEAENAQLKAWKQSYLAVESEWGVQEVGKLLNVEWGKMIHREIIPGIKRLIEERDRYKALVESADDEGGSLMWTSDHEKIVSGLKGAK